MYLVLEDEPKKTTARLVHPTAITASSFSNRQDDIQ